MGEIARTDQKGVLLKLLSTWVSNETGGRCRQFLGMVGPHENGEGQWQGLADRPLEGQLFLAIILLSKILVPTINK